MATNDKKSDDNLRRVKLRNVRLSFPHLFEPQERDTDDGGTRKNYNCVVMVPKDHDEIKQILAGVKRAGTEAKKKTWGDDPSKWPNIPSHQQCFKDGDNPDHTDRPEYEGHYFMNLSAPVDRPPAVVTNRKNSDNEWIEAQPGQKNAPYAGCYVNVIAEIWGQKKNTEKKMPVRLNGNVEVVQFLRDGEAFGAKRADANDLLDDDDVGEEGDISMDGDEDRYGGGDDDGLL